MTLTPVFDTWAKVRSGHHGRSWRRRTVTVRVLAQPSRPPSPARTLELSQIGVSAYRRHDEELASAAEVNIAAGATVVSASATTPVKAVIDS